MNAGQRGARALLERSGWLSCLYFWEGQLVLELDEVVLPALMMKSVPSSVVAAAGPVGQGAACQLLPFLDTYLACQAGTLQAAGRGSRGLPWAMVGLASLISYPHFPPSRQSPSGEADGIFPFSSEDLSVLAGCALCGCTP